MKRIKFKQELIYKNMKREFNVTVDKPDDMHLTIYMAGLIFINSIKDEKLRRARLSQHRHQYGRESQFDLDELTRVEVVRVEEIKLFDDLEFNTVN